MSMWSRVWILAAVGIGGTLGSIADAAGDETLLRWKLAAGELLTVRFQQATDTETSGAQKSQLAIEMSADMTWRVESVEEDGTARLVQKVDRLQMAMSADKLADVKYDSASDQSPTGTAKDIAASVQPLIGVEFHVTMNPRGEIVEVTPPDDLQLDERIGKLVPDLLRQAAIVLPADPVADGDDWTDEDTIDSPLGRLIRRRRFQYQSVVNRQGRALAQIASTTSLDMQAEGESNPRLIAQQQSGEFWFDVQRGRLAASSVVQELTTERTYRDLRTRVKTRSTLQTTISAADS